MEKRVIKFRVWEGTRMHDDAEAKRVLYNLSNGSSLTPSYPVMQYTGLKDKNGKEIYEGDVDRFGWVVCFEDGVFCLKQTLNAKTFIPIHESNIDEVIGNIYEHPNLLTETSGK